MKIPVLGDLMTEINRLFIAGAKLSADDPRLLRLIPVLEKMGERAPVFKKLADDVSGLASSSPEEAGERLLALGTLLYAILYTQGDTDASGEYAALEAMPGTHILSAVQTDVNYGRLRPLIEALTTQKPGRLETVQTALKDGLFRDMRTHRAAAHALDDRYGEIVTLLEQTVIPEIGSAAIPHLLSSYDACGDKGSGRRLCLLKRLGYEGADLLAKQALDDNDASLHVCVAAVEVLGQSNENEQLLLALAKDKKKEMREAALIALAEQDSPQGKELLKEAFCGKGYKASIAAMSRCRDKEIKLVALEMVKKLEVEVLAGEGEKKDQVARCEKFLECAQALSGLPEADILKYMRHVLTSSELRGAKGMGSWAMQSVYKEYLDEFDRLPYDEAMSTLKEMAEDKELSKTYAYGVRLWFLKAAQTYTPREMYKEFHRFYIANQLDAQVFEQAYPENTREKLDERWLDEWLKNRNAQFRMLAVDLCDSKEKRQMKLLISLLEDNVKELAKKKTSYLPYGMPKLLEKLIDSGIDLKKEIKKDEAQQILNSRGGKLSQQVEQALIAISQKS